MRVPGLLVFLALLSGGCAEGGLFESAPTAPEYVRAERRDAQLLAYRSQLATLAHQLRDEQQQNYALERDLFAQLEQVHEANQSLAERVEALESERTVPAPATPPGKGARDDASSAETLRRALAVASARDARLAEELARLARMLAPGAPNPPPPAAPAVDLVDAFGSRK
jgi:hypothetical protein